MRVYYVKLARTSPFLSPGLYELSVLRELHDPRVRIPAVSVRDENVAVGRSDDIGRLIEGVRAVAGDSNFAERQQDLSIRTELDDDVSLPDRCLSRRAGRDSVGHPDVSVSVHMHAVREYEHPLAEAVHELDRRIKLEDGRHLRSHAGVRSASLSDPD